MFDLLDRAVYDTVHDAPGGAVGLAPLVGMNAGTLNNKANPSMETHQLSLRESIPVQLHLRDYRILATYAGLLSHGVIPLGNFRSCSDIELLDLYAQYHEELGQTAQAIRQALAGGRITSGHVRHIEGEMIEDFQAGLAVVARLKALVEDDRK